MEKISEYFVCNLFSKQIQSEEQKEVYTYGMTLLLTTILGIISILLFSAIFFTLEQGLFFLFIFSLLRIHSGGYHCKTYANCFVVSNLIFLMVLTCAKWVMVFSVPVISLIDVALFVISWIYIIRNAPVLTVNHRLPHKKLVKNRRKAIVLSSCTLCIGCACLLLWSGNALVLQYCTLAAITEASVFVLMLILKIKERRISNA